jgi:hypothetical protein
MQKETKLNIIEAVLLIPLCVLGLLVNIWFTISAIFLFLGFSLYRKWISPGGSW